ncbi:TPA: hypothetical protein ACXNIW_001136 [Proteus mirabilis]
MSKLTIGGVNVSTSQINKLSHASKARDAMSIWEKIKDWFNHGQKEQVLNLLYHTYFNPKISIFDKVDCFAELYSMAGAQYKDNFHLYLKDGYDLKMKFIIKNVYNGEVLLDNLIKDMMDRIHNKNPSIEKDIGNIRSYIRRRLHEIPNYVNHDINQYNFYLSQIKNDLLPNDYFNVERYLDGVTDFVRLYNINNYRISVDDKIEDRCKLQKFMNIIQHIDIEYRKNIQIKLLMNTVDLNIKDKNSKEFLNLIKIKLLSFYNPHVDIIEGFIEHGMETLFKDENKKEKACRTLRKAIIDYNFPFIRTLEFNVTDETINNIYINNLVPSEYISFRQ